jgi:hypothetical protein
VSSPLPVKDNWITGDDWTPAAANDAADAINAMGLVVQSVQTTNYTASAGQLVPCDATGGTFTVTLPTAPLDTSHVAVIKVDNTSTGVSVITGGSDVFNASGGLTSTSIASQDEVLVWQYAASPGIWYLISGGSSGGGGGGGSSQVFGEVPSGTLNGINTTFTTSQNFVSGTTSVFRNGLREQLSVGYTESSPHIVFSAAPLSSDVITVDYVLP